MFGFFALANMQFDSTIMKYFWVLFSLLMLAFLFLIAAIGSNVSSTPCGQENLGYLGIGLIYAMILLSLLACGYLLWNTMRNIYTYYFKNKDFIVNLDQQKV